MPDSSRDELGSYRDQHNSSNMKTQLQPDAINDVDLDYGNPFVPGGDGRKVMTKTAPGNLRRQRASTRSDKATRVQSSDIGLPSDSTLQPSRHTARPAASIATADVMRRKSGADGAINSIEMAADENYDRVHVSDLSEDTSDDSIKAVNAEEVARLKNDVR